MMKKVVTLTLVVSMTQVLSGASASQSANKPARTPPVAAPTTSKFIPPPENACQSAYDRFYGTEPGVYAYWAMCEAGTPIDIHDYVGQWDLSVRSKAFGVGVVRGGAAGPVQDGETAASVATAAADIANQDITMNTNQGTIASWINADATERAVTALNLSAVGHHSGVAIGLKSEKDGLCFTGSFTNDQNAAYGVQSCGYTANVWHRVVLSWSSGTEILYVDGKVASTGTYTGRLDNWVFIYKLFPGCCNTGKQMTLAKALVANLFWSGSQVTADLNPVFPAIPRGGVYVGLHKLGTIHRDVLGYADYNLDISTPAKIETLKRALAEGGFTALRYANSYGGITADEAQWQGGASCVYGKLGVSRPAQNVATANNLDTYIPKIAQPLGLSVAYTVNYATNPPLCNAGGDPVANGAKLVAYANKIKGYGIKYWEIGNEGYSNTTEMDLHPNPNTGASYAKYEPAFYAEMKAVDPDIKIAVPVSLGNYSWATQYSMPILSDASYDAVIFHSYPIRDPITDGDTLYQDRVASNLNRVHGALATLQTSLMNNGKRPDAIWITEWDDEVGGDKWSKQTLGAVAPLFTVIQLAEYMQAGVQYATWWAEGGTGVCTNANYDYKGETSYSWVKCGNTALVYMGQKDQATEVPVGMKQGDLMPAARGFEVLAQSGFVAEGEHMLRTEADGKGAPWLLSYAATHGTSYAVILINRDETATHVVPVKLEGKASGSSVHSWTYGKAQYDQTYFHDWEAKPVTATYGSWSGTYSATLPPWSVTVLVFGK